MIESFVQWVVGLVGSWGYTGIVVMMALESSFVPFPSEVVMIPTGYLASQGLISAPVAVAMGLVGSLLGALVNFYMAVYLGRPFLLRWGSFFFLDENKFRRVEEFFRTHGEIGTFSGRLIPVVRQYISFSAGLARMNMVRFLFFTGLGAGIWITILTCIGYVAGQNQQLIKQYSSRATIVTLLVCIVIIIVYAVWFRRKKQATPALVSESKPGTPN